MCKLMGISGGKAHRSFSICIQFRRLPMLHLPTRTICSGYRTCEKGGGQCERYLHHAFHVLLPGGRLGSCRRCSGACHSKDVSQVRALTFWQPPSFVQGRQIRKAGKRWGKSTITLFSQLRLLSSSSILHHHHQQIQSTHQDPYPASL